MEGDLQRTVGDNVRAIRHELDDSQEAFAERVGWHRTYVGGIERGERNITLKALERLTDILDVDPLTLLTPRGCEG